MQTNYRNIKGTFDILPDTYTAAGVVTPGTPAWRFVEETILEVSSRFGFREIRTPIFEPTELVARGIGELTDIVTKEMFAFEKGSTHYVLRPEFTAPVMRAYLQHRLDQQGAVQRLFYIGPCFRAERPARGRFRQFHQFGAEVIGSDEPRADAEIIALMSEIYRAFGLEGGLLRINSLGSPQAREAYREKLKAFLDPYRNDLSEISQKRLETNPLRILDTKLEHEQQILEEAPYMTDCLDSESREFFDTVCAYLDDLQIEYTVDPRLVRGLDYYTHTAFELLGDRLGAQNALAGGGRYDLLAEDLGNKGAVPAVGFAAGIERLLVSLVEQGTPLPTDPSPDVFLVGLGDDATRWCFGKANALRTLGMRTSFDLKGRSLKAQMREANRLGASYVVIVGDNELSEQKAAVKIMATGEQSDVSFHDLDAHLVTKVRK